MPACFQGYATCADIQDHTIRRAPCSLSGFTVVILEFLIFISGRSVLMFHRAPEIILLVLAGESLTKDFIKARRKTKEKMRGKLLLVKK